MKMYGQVDGRAIDPAKASDWDRWAGTVADPNFWMWLQGHALNHAHDQPDTLAATYRALSTVAGDLLKHRADAMAADMRGLRPGNAKNRRR